MFFAVQSEIAQAVAAQLKIKLLGEQPAADSARSNPNPAAHDALLQGTFYASKGNADGIRKAIGYATEATQLDPNYAEAWATLAALWRNYGVSDATDDIDQAYASARAAAAKAVALDPNSIDAFIVMSGLALAPDLDFASAEKYGRRAHELAPGTVDGLGDLASALIAQGKLEEAFAAQARNHRRRSVAGLNVSNWPRLGGPSSLRRGANDVYQIPGDEAEGGTRPHAIRHSGYLGK